ncbi:hypothetical protein SERLADRAFT_404680 [Serpula lacrymans var. lacrymans S7.9]|uniref:Uncharacterized protein n=1 Tax=Serpula lacrymans var. lacrymans (strain S7.9) TaxID=578457 RepID=F8NED2_SERL9|nr:uncharacterized protein SERLADRAFT_404680 [Serpula lacrymans var. lacrymans S7.9]EGO30566.1 hypothetical protein SERLADRAFT_404680 [Serpula lacrymans var. lacrymans S7.9]
MQVTLKFLTLCRTNLIRLRKVKSPTVTASADPTAETLESCKREKYLHLRKLTVYICGEFGGGIIMIMGYGKSNCEVGGGNIIIGYCKACLEGRVACAKVLTAYLEGRVVHLEGSVWVDINGKVLACSEDTIGVPVLVLMGVESRWFNDWLSSSEWLWVYFYTNQISVIHLKTMAQISEMFVAACIMDGISIDTIGVDAIVLYICYAYYVLEFIY